MDIEDRPVKPDRARRAFLKAVGASAMALPFSRLLGSSISEAGGATSPLRLLVIFNPLGTPEKYWRPRAPGNITPGSGTTTGFDLGFTDSVLGPLARHRSKLVVLDGIDLLPVAQFAAAGHESTPSLLTGDIFSSNGINPTVASLDQYLGQQAAIGGQTAFRSLELSVGGNKSDYRVLSWGAGGKRLPRMLNPYHTFQTVFSGYKAPRPPDAGTTAPAIDTAAMQKSALGYVHADLTRLRRRLGTLEQQKLDQHLQAVSDLQRKINGGSGGQMMGPGPAMSAVCTPPAQLPEEPTWKGLYQENPNNNCYFNSNGYGSFMFEHMQQWSDLQSSMITQAFACDLTRVITLQYFEDGCDGLAPWAGVTEDPHVVSHENSQSPGLPEKMSTYQRWFSRQVASLMDQLAAVPEGDGTVLDHTAILWVNENGYPEAHSPRKIPVVLAGGFNNLISTGRYLKYPSGTPHNQLLVSLANLFPGVSLSSYGNTPGHLWSTGGLPSL